MGRKKLLNKLAEFFDLGAAEKAKKRKEMRKVLSQLKQKEKQLLDKLQSETDQEEQKKLQQKIDLIHSQRKKGHGVLQELDEKN